MTGPEPRAGFWSLVHAYGVSDLLILWRMKTPIAFMFAVPGVLAVTLGPAVAGAGSHGRTMIGLAVTFSFMTVNYVGLALFREFGNNTWVRQATLRPPRAAFLLGKLLPVALAGSLQLLLFGTIAVVAYRTPVHGSLAQLLVVGLGLIAVGCVLGVVLYNATRNTSVFQSLAYIVLISTGSLGGAIVPADRLPAVSRAIGTATPQFWAMRAVEETTVGGGSWTPTLQALAVIGGLVLLLGGIGWVNFDYQNEKSDLS